MLSMLNGLPVEAFHHQDEVLQNVQQQSSILSSELADALDAKAGVLHRLSSLEQASEDRIGAADRSLQAAKQDLRRLAIERKAQDDRIAEQKKLAAEAVAAATATTTVHPVYGELVQDLGYKRVFCVSPDRLIDTEAFPIWEKQRVFREARASNIAKAMSSSSFGFPGVITVFETAESRAIIDGQHRVGALRMLRGENLWPEDRRILVEVHSVETDDEVALLFADINKAQPLNLVDMPGAMPDMTRQHLDQATEILAAKYGTMFSDSMQCRVPHVNIDTLRDDIFQSGIITQHSLNSTEALVEWLEQANGDLAAADANTRWKEQLRKPAFGKAFSKATKHGFFLGLDKCWL